MSVSGCIVAEDGTMFTLSRTGGRIVTSDEMVTLTSVSSSTSYVTTHSIVPLPSSSPAVNSTLALASKLKLPRSESDMLHEYDRSSVTVSPPYFTSTMDNAWTPPAGMSGIGSGLMLASRSLVLSPVKRSSTAVPINAATTMIAITTINIFFLSAFLGGETDSGVPSSAMPADAVSSTAGTLELVFSDTIVSP